MHAWAALLALGLTGTAAAVSAPAAAQVAEGDWTGRLGTPYGELPLLVHIRKTASGYSGTMDSPDQGADSLPIAGLTLKGAALAFEVPAVRGAYAARWDPSKSVWVGQLTEAGQPFPLSLARTTPAATPPPAK